MKNLILVLTGLFFLNFTSCEETSLQNEMNLEGTWIFEEFFLGDAILSGCGWEGADVRTMTLVVSKENGLYKVSGNAPVNSYFSSIEVLSFDTETQIGKIKVAPIGSTKMAGPQPLMQCETQYFDMLGSAGDISLNTDSNLRIGRFRTPESNPRDGGTFLVFKKAKGE